MITPQNLVRHELIGLPCEVILLRNPQKTHIKGIVIDESRNTLTLETEGKEKTAVKEECIFIFTLPTKERVRVSGQVIISRPEDRIKKKLKGW